MAEIKTVVLTGSAGRKFGRSFKLAVKSPAEAFRALCSLLPGLKAWVLTQHEAGIAWRVVTTARRGLTAEELESSTGSDVIIFAPVMRGAGGGGGGIFAIVLGVVLIAVALIIPFAAPAGGLGIGLLGGSLVLGGVASLLTPTPKLEGQSITGEGPSSGNPGSGLESSLFTRGATNDAQGEVVPVLYGRRRIPAPRLISFELRLKPSSRAVNTANRRGLLGYVNQQDF